MSEIPEYTVVVSLDAKHIEQFSHTWPTWKKNKPSLISHPMVAIYDGKQLTDERVADVIDHPYLVMADWNQHCALDYGNGTDKWYNPQRYRMLASFVHMPGRFVKTPYWLKIDTDAVAMGMDDWIDPTWFDNNPAIISHPWGFTRPPNQMELLDAWVEKHELLTELKKHPPLELHPKPGEDRVCHPRIGSWCAFFNTQFTRECSEWAEATCGTGLLPVPSQDGYLWYCAKRLELGIVRPRMKARGWQIWSTIKNIKKAVGEASNAI